MTSVDLLIMMAEAKAEEYERDAMKIRRIKLARRKSRGDYNV